MDLQLVDKSTWIDMQRVCVIEVRHNKIIATTVAGTQHELKAFNTREDAMAYLPEITKLTSIRFHGPFPEPPKPQPPQPKQPYRGELRMPGFDQ